MTDIVERLRSPEVFITHGQMISPVAFEAAAEILRLRAALANARNEALEEATLIATRHSPPEVKKRIMSDDTWDEIQTEQRGEKIAAEIIARKIRALKTPPEDGA